MIDYGNGKYGHVVACPGCGTLYSHLDGCRVTKLHADVDRMVLSAGSPDKIFVVRDATDYDIMRIRYRVGK